MNRNRIYSTRTGAQPSNPSTRTKRAETRSNEAAGMSCRTPHPTERRSRTTPHHGRTPFMTRRTGRGQGRAHSDVEPETWAAALTRSSLHPQRRLSAGRFGWSKGSIGGNHRRMPRATSSTHNGPNKTVAHSRLNAFVSTFVKVNF